MVYGFHRFSDIATLTGAHRTLLTARPRKLEEAGVIERQQCSEHPPRLGYYLTEAGEDLIPVILTLKEWGDRHAGASELKAVFEHSCGDVFHPVTGEAVRTASMNAAAAGCASDTRRRDRAS